MPPTKGRSCLKFVVFCKKAKAPRQRGTHIKGVLCIANKVEERFSCSSFANSDFLVNYAC